MIMINDSIAILADIIVSETKNLLHQLKTEEDLKIAFEKILEPIKKELCQIIH